ncbi:MAG: methyltransferase domain-containing protein [SAR202 cluster bacterium]|nr:methyltransferase domain-containing protein [SAR202 cluster bacterium]
MAESVDKKHWTHRLFVESPELFLPFLEKAEDRAEAEVAVLARLLGEHGVPSGGRILDTACGIGRHALPLARRGYRVTGFDIAPTYVERARERAAVQSGDAEFFVGDVRDVGAQLAERGPFDAIVNMFTSIGYYGRASDLALFQGLGAKASSGAVMVVQTTNRDWLVRHFESEGVDTAGAFRILQRRKLNLRRSTIHNDWEFYEGSGSSLRILLKLQLAHMVYGVEELRGLVEEAGWEFVEGLGSQRGGEIGLAELSPDLMDMWVVARWP